MSTQHIVVPATGHKEKEPVKENEVAATCTEDGSYDLVVYCETCGEVVSTQHIVVPATGHKELAPVKENVIAPTATHSGSHDEVVYCAVCGEELSRETVKDDPTFLLRKGSQLLLNGRIEFQFVAIFAEDVENPTMTISREGVEAVTIPGTLSDEGFYVFSYAVPLKEMNDVMTYTYSGTQNGEVITTEEFTFNVIENYVRKQLTNPDVVANVNLKNQITTLLTFAAKAQEHFGYNTENPADAILTELGMEVELDYSKVTEAEKEVVKTIDDAKANFIGRTFDLEADTSMLCFFRPAANLDMNSLYLAYRDVERSEEYAYTKVTGKKMWNQYYASIPNIPGNALSDTFEYYLCTFDGETYTQVSNTERYSAMCYASETMGEDDQVMKDVAVAMMTYAEASKAYHEDPNSEHVGTEMPADEESQEIAMDD